MHASGFADLHLHMLVLWCQEVSEELVPHLEVILQQLMCDYGKYQVGRNLNILFYILFCKCIDYYQALLCQLSHSYF
jgi:hypothetical protein